MRTVLTLALSLALACGGKKDKDKPPEPTPGSQTQGSSMQQGSSTGSGSAQGSSEGSGSAMGSGQGSGSAGEVPMQHAAGNCPSMVLGAETKVALKGKDVTITITATDKDAIATIQKRTEELLKEKSDGTTGSTHDQKGTHGGGMGLCPVYWPEGGKATQKKDAKGVTVTITPKDKPEELKTLLEDRMKKSADWVKKNIKPGDQGNMGGVGGGSGEHGGTHQGSGDGKGKERKAGSGGGKGTGGGGGGGTGGGSGGGSGKGSAK